MSLTILAATTVPLDSLSSFKLVLPIALLVMLWCWETWQPFFEQSRHRTQHAVRNVSVALLNTAVLGLLFGAVTVWVARWVAQNEFGLLNRVTLPPAIQFVAALVLYDGWMYAWHRANHTIPLLWRFHRMHHSDPHMDVTTATRFHLGEHLGAATLRLGIIPLLGLSIWQIVVYEMLVIAITQFHHANVSIGSWDRWLRLVIVTPYMHKVHHSDWQPETDSNYSTVLSVWDRLAGTFRMRSDPHTLVFGLAEFRDPKWNSFWGMLKTPLVSQRRERPAQISEAATTHVEPTTPAKTWGAGTEQTALS